MAAIAPLQEQIVRLVGEIQALPYFWPCPPDGESARTAGAGSCASKHALLSEELSDLHIDSMPLLLIGPLVPAALRNNPEFEAAIDLLEVHECLTLLTPWAGPLRVDVTWDPPLILLGLPGTLRWDGQSDMIPAVDGDGPGWSVPRSRLREAKEALRRRLYAPGQRELRDATLGRLAEQFQAWRKGAS